MPDQPEVLGLLALMLFHDSRRGTRTGPEGELILLSDQDRSRWDRAEIEEGVRVLNHALRLRRPGRYQLEAAIAALHASAPSAEEIDWPQIAALYEQLLVFLPSPVVALNRAVAVAEAGRPEDGLELVDRIEGLERYHLLHAVRADFLRRLDRPAEASDAYRRALELTRNPAEQEFIARRLERARGRLTASPRLRARDASIHPTAHHGRRSIAPERGHPRGRADRRRVGDRRRARSSTPAPRSASAASIEDGAVLGKRPRLRAGSSAAGGELAPLVLEADVTVCCGAVVYAGAYVGRAGDHRRPGAGARTHRGSGPDRSSAAAPRSTSAPRSATAS